MQYSRKAAIILINKKENIDSKKRILQNSINFNIFMLPKFSKDFLKQ